MADAAVAARGVYTPRRPQASPLFRLVSDQVHRLQTVYDERFAREYGPWRPVVGSPGPRGVGDRAVRSPDTRPSPIEIPILIGMSRTILFANVDTGEPGYIHFGSARDFARFGILTLNHGRWNGNQMLADSALLLQARRPSGSDNLSYGWFWWLNGGASNRTPGPSLLPTNPGPLFSATPADLASALGLDDKKLYVVPSRDLVIVRLGEKAPISGADSPAAISSFDNAFWTRLMAARAP